MTVVIRDKILLDVVIRDKKLVGVVIRGTFFSDVFRCLLLEFLKSLNDHSTIMNRWIMVESNTLYKIV